jgi:glycosyltransferase involved in cell wall biosynthesis
MSGKKEEKNIIFHIPWAINKNHPSGSQIRPVNMYKAFQSLGYNVEFIMGDANNRAKQIEKIKNQIIKGKKYDFVYSECSTYPTTIASGLKDCISHPFLDYRFFSYCRNKNIPLGLFYRDVHWKFSHFYIDKNPLKVMLLKLLYKIDIEVYNKYVDILYVPSKKMASYAGIKNRKISNLPPGTKKYKESIKTSYDNKLNLLYVGGIMGQYDMSKIFRAVNKIPNVELVICCRKKEWNKAYNNYAPYLGENIIITHKSGKELQKLYEKADIGLFYTIPSKYWEITHPIKVFEYIGNYKPIIATKGTISAEFIESKGIGWSIPYEEQEITRLLNKIIKDKTTINTKIKNIEMIISENTWEERAKKVVNDLTT